MKLGRLASVVVALCTLSSSQLASAQPVTRDLVGWTAEESEAFRAAQAELTVYEFDRPQLYGALRSLRTLGDHLQARSPLSSVRYARAVAATEMLIVMRLTGDAAHEEQLQAAYGGDGTLVDRLRADFAAIEVPILRQPALETQLLLQAVVEDRPEVLAGVPEPRRSGLWALLDRGGSQRAGCNEDLRFEDEDGTPVEGLVLDDQTRSSLNRMSCTLASIDRAVRGASSGDPLLAALVEPLSSRREALESIVVRDQRFAEGTPSIEALLSVDSSGVRLAVLPHFRLIDAGQVLVEDAAVNSGAGERVVSFPSTLPTLARPIDALAAAFESLGLPRESHIAITVSDGTPTDLVIRTLLSLQRANLNATHFAQPDRDHLALIPFTSARASTVESMPLQVHVRVGGYGIQGRHGGEVSIPRVRQGTALSFDRSALRSALSRRGAAQVSVDAMASVDAAELVAVAESLEGRAVVVLP